ncbi:hypothetical protein G9A89_017622 [Geosiphon pyriformis]|nr:hypothetical protein G9A89_017622 [Geosiphon pyriformis]
MGTKLLFTGHGIGGAIAAITALTWKIRTADTPGLRDIPIITVTFGAPRIGNEKLARLMNKMLRVRRFTNTNDYVPHFPQIKNGVDILRHHETEYWIFPKSCDCPQDSEIYMCQGYFYPTRSWQIVGSFDEFLSLEGISSGENPVCLKKIFRNSDH